MNLSSAGLENLGKASGKRAFSNRSHVSTHRSQKTSVKQQCRVVETSAKLMA